MSPHTSTLPDLDVKTALWKATQACMTHYWGGQNLALLASKSKVGIATLHRLKLTNTSIGIDIVSKIAAVFGLQAWQLLTPAFDPASPPQLAPLSAAERHLYENIRAAAKNMVAEELHHMQRGPNETTRK